MQVGAEDDVWLDAQDSLDANTEDTASVDAEDNLVNVDGDGEDYEDDVWEEPEDNVLVHATYDAWMLRKILSMLAWLKKLASCLPTLPSITYICNCIHRAYSQQSSEQTKNLIDDCKITLSNQQFTSRINMSMSFISK